MSKCRDCGLPLIFKEVDGKQFPFNPDGSDHWDLCSKTRTAKVIAGGKLFKDKVGEGYVFKGKKIYMIMSSGWHTGKNYVERPYSNNPPFKLGV